MKSENDYLQVEKAKFNIEELNSLALVILAGGSFKQSLLKDYFLAALNLANQYHNAAKELEPGHEIASCIADYIHRDKATGGYVIPDLLATHLMEIFPEIELTEIQSNIRRLKIIR